MNRRRFLLQSTATAASALGFPAVVRCASPNSMLQVACVGVAQAHRPTTVSIDRIVESEVTNVGPVALRQIRELIAELLEI